jgi:hypothetical protein
MVVKVDVFFIEVVVVKVVVALVVVNVMVTVIVVVVFEVEKEVVVVFVVIFSTVRILVTTLLFSGLDELNGSEEHDRPLGHVNELQSEIFFGIHLPI